MTNNTNAGNALDLTISWEPEASSSEPFITIGQKGSFTISRPPANLREKRELGLALGGTFSQLFAGNPNGFYYRLADGSYKAVHREPKASDFFAHLTGQTNRAMLSVPLLPNERACWGAIDVDRKQPEDEPIDWAALSRRVTELKLPLIVCRSKGGKGAWLFIFFRELEGIPSALVQQLLKHYSDLLNLGKVEIFPKQTKLSGEKEFGSGINLPYHGKDRVAFGREGEELSLDGFLALAAERCFYGELLVRDVPTASGSQTQDNVSNEIAVESAVAYLDRLCADLESMTDGRQKLCTDRCFYLGRVVGGNQQLRDPRLAIKTIEDRVTKAIEKSPGPKWPKPRYEVIARQLKVGMNQPIKIIPARIILDESELLIADLPEACLDGWLGEICSNKMHDFPRAWAWPALLSAASVHVRHSGSIRTNIYTALVGAKGYGKTSAIKVANRLMSMTSTVFFDDYVGSAEGLAKHLPNEVEAQPRLWFVDELGQLLDKARIEGASFVRVLNTVFYQDRQALIVAKGARHGFNCKLSLIGGIVDEDFEDAFSAITSHGLYDRFIFGYGPTGYCYNWHPIEDYGEPLVSAPPFCESGREPAFVGRVNSDVWELKRSWVKEHPGLNREFELALRCALICASFDGRTELSAASLGPALAFAEVQAKIRNLLKPNLGKNQGGELGQKITDYLKQHSPNGEWLRLRTVTQKTNAYRYGPDLVNRVLNAMSYCGEIELAEDKSNAQKPRIVRLKQLITP